MASILIIHQNMPGQFQHLAAALAARGDDVMFMTRRHDRQIDGVARAVYTLAREPDLSIHPYLQQTEAAVLHGQAVARTCLALQHQGFTPDLIVAHPGWGEALFVKDVFPATPLLSYGEFYYRAFGADLNFDPEDPGDLDTICRLRTRNSHLLHALEVADCVLSPTAWQRSVHPAAFHHKIEVIFDGIDTDLVRPDPAACFRLPTGRLLTRADEVVTFATRNLDPYRGFPTFMRALPRLLAARPNAQIVILGGDEPGYGRAAPMGMTWRQAMTAELGEDLSRFENRVHFLGHRPYAEYLNLLQVSTAHVYLTVPFVLSWSMLEAMAAGCLIIGSATAPVMEVIEEGRSGMLVDFFDSNTLASRIEESLTSGAGSVSMRAQARHRIVDGYARSVCLPKQLQLVDRLLKQ